MEMKIVEKQRVSIIIPIYQVEKYICRCVDSVKEQSFSNYELIMIDDGSFDAGGVLIDEYAIEDPRQIVIHSRNSGVSMARNYGIEMVSGQRITFVDGDDWVEFDYIEKLVKNNEDLVLQTAICVNETGKEISSNYLNDNRIIDVSNKVISKLLKEGTLNWTVCKLFSTEKINKERVRFNISLNLGEDTLFVVEYAMKCETILAENIANYRYVIYDTNSRTTLSNKWTKDRKKMLAKANKIICNTIFNNNKIKAFCLYEYRQNANLKTIMHNLLHSPNKLLIRILGKDKYKNFKEKLKGENK